ncbi:MAG: hypothetical protein HY291_07480 [Planctomycetes bacterium]|nr:hypothetical protein [Planctomycetota bacterium]
MALQGPDRRGMDPRNKNAPRRVSGSHPPQKRASGGAGVPPQAVARKPSERAPAQPAVKAPAAAPAPRVQAAAPAPVPRRVSGGHARPVSEAPKPAAAGAPRRASGGHARPTAAAAPASATAPKRISGAHAKPASDRKAAVAPPPEAVKTSAAAAPEKKAVVSVHAKPQAAPGSERKRWTAIVALLAVACVALAASTAWLWLLKPGGGADAPKAAHEDGKGPLAARKVSSKGSEAAPEEAKPTAHFLSRDDKRSGTWKKTVGKDGYVIFNKNGGGQHDLKLPDYIGEVASSGDHCVWAVDQDPRGLEDPVDPARRYKVCEYSGSDFTVSIRTLRPVTYRLSVYCLDGDKLGRRQRVDVMADEKVLHAVDVDKMDNGVWLNYEISGSVDLKFTNLNNYNAVLAGIFFDTPEDQKIAKRAPPKGPAPESEAGLQPGVWAEYFDKVPTYANVKDVPTCRRAEINLDFGAMQPLQPGQGMPDWPFSGACAAIFSGYVKIAEDGPHTFFLSSDDGSRLYIDGELAVDNDGRHGMKEAAKQLDLKAGLHRFWLEYFNYSVPMGLSVQLKAKDGPRGPIPESMLFHDPAEALSEDAHADSVLANR